MISQYLGECDRISFGCFCSFIYLLEKEKLDLYVPKVFPGKLKDSRYFTEDELNKMMIIFFTIEKEDSFTTNFVLKIFNYAKDI